MKVRCVGVLVALSLLGSAKAAVRAARTARSPEGPAEPVPAQRSQPECGDDRRLRAIEGRGRHRHQGPEARVGPRDCRRGETAHQTADHDHHQHVGFRRSRRRQHRPREQPDGDHRARARRDGHAEDDADVYEAQRRRPADADLQGPAHPRQRTGPHRAVLPGRRALSCRHVRRDPRIACPADR